MKKGKKLAAMMIAFSVMTAILGGCGSKPAVTTELEFKEEVKTEEAKADLNGETPTDEGYGMLREARVEKIGSLNPQTYINSYASEQIKRTSLLLYGYFPTDDYTFCELTGELAIVDPIQVDEEGKVWHIKLREGVVWENGDVLNADDVVYTWKMMLDPKLANLRASNFAKDVIEIENAMKYFQGECTWEEVGLRKVDDLTVEIRTVAMQDTKEVKTHLAHPANCIINEEYYEKFMNADRTETMYGASADKWISAGPFVLDSWVNDAEITFKKNPNYIFKDRIWIAGINTKVVKDAGTQMQLFENGETDYISLSPENYLKYEEDPRILIEPYNSVTHITMNSANPNQPVLGNEKFRQSLSYATDRKVLADLTKQDPANYIVPTTHIIDLESGTQFRETEEAKANLSDNYGYDPEKAKVLFEEALAETGVDKVSLTMIYNDTGIHVTMSEFLQENWPKVLGKDKFELKLQAMPSSQRGDQIRNWVNDPTSYELSWGGWNSTDLMPWNAFKYWTTYYSAKNEPFLSQEFDTVFDASNFGAERFGEGVRLNQVAQMEKMLIEPAIVIPVSQNSYKYLKSNRIELTMKNWANRVNYGWDYAKIVE